MDFAYLIPVLALVTLFLVLVFAWWNKRKTQERLEDPTSPKSTLASDAPSHRRHPPDT